MTPIEAAQDAISRWRELREQGRPISIEELCGGQPEVLAEARKRLEALADVEALLNPPNETPLPESPTIIRPGNAPPPLALRFGDFLLLRKLGEGGMGRVYEAEDTVLHRRVAVKVMRPEVAASPEARQRFLREVRAMAAVEHERIIPIHRVGEFEFEGIKAPYLMMPLLRGQSLRQRLENLSKLALDEVMAISSQIAEGLAAAHAARLIHRDIKPDNVWLKESAGNEPSVVVLDFGLARAVKSQGMLSRTGAVMGTPAYMAPEQAEGKTIDARADLFSLGCVLYEMTTGRRPFTGPSMMSILTQIATHHPPSPHQIDPVMPLPWSNLVMRLLEKKPEQRPASARDVVEIIRELEHGDAGPKTLVRGLGSRKSIGRRVGVLLAGGLAILGLIAASIVFAVQQHPGAQTNPSESSLPCPEVEAALKGDIDIRIHAEEDVGRQDVSLDHGRALPLRAGDSIAVKAWMDRPAFLYMLWIGTTGKVEPVYPWNPGQWDTRPEVEKPVRSLRRPEDSTEFYPLKPGNPGMETLVLLARETPLPRDVDLKAELGAFAPQTEQNIRARVWFENGEAIRDRPGREPDFFSIRRSNDPVLATVKRIKEIQDRHFCYSLAVSFANQGQ